jgi:hypothetical protein
MTKKEIDDYFTANWKDIQKVYKDERSQMRYG